MKDIDNGYGEFEDQDGYKRKFEFSDYVARHDMAGADNFVFDHYCLNDGTATIGGGRIGNKLYFAISFCAPNDNFSRQVGRENVWHNFVLDDRSHRRAVVDISEVKDEPPSKVLAYALMQYLKRDKCVPQWAKNPVVAFRNRRLAQPASKPRRPLSAEAQKAREPRPPEELVDALQDSIHMERGRILASEPIRKPQR
jgi:hypothetical protein